MKKCKVVGCERPYCAKGLCNTHYVAQRRQDPKNRAAELDRKRRAYREKPGEADRIRAYRRRYYSAKRTQCIAAVVRYRQTPEGKAGRRRHYQNRRDYYISLARKRDGLRKQAFPVWANKERIAEFYRNCPEGHHVDHIVPLQGKNVCGLHVETNLQYLTAVENRRKSNKF